MDIDRFIRDGYVAIRGAVNAETVEACREKIWEAVARRGVCESDRTTWPALVHVGEELTGLAMAGVRSA